DHTYGGGFGMNLGRSLGLTVDLGRLFTHYQPGHEFAGVDLAAQLNHRSTNLKTGVRVGLTPFTSFSVDAGYALDEFDAEQFRNTENFRTSATISFTPDAVASGHATVGYHKMNPSFHDAAAGGAVAFSGLTASVDVGYTLV